MRPLLLLLAFALAQAHSARILGIFPHTGKSHQMVFDPLLRTLAERGHHVTTVSFFPLKNPPANYTDVSLEGIAGLGLESFDLSIYEAPNLLLKIPIVKRIAKQLLEFQPLAGMALNVCGKALDWPPLVEALKGDYDVIIVENFNSDCMLGLLHVYGIRSPVVALLSSGFLPWSGNRMGIFENPAYVPVISTSFTAPLNFLERLENTFLYLYHNLWFHYSIQVKEHELIEKRFGRKIPELGELSRNYSLMMVNTFNALNGVKPTVPGVVEVGGMHLDHTRKVIPSSFLRRESVDMRPTRPLLILFAFALLSANGECARILGLFPHVGKSHYMAFQPLMLKLAERGHQVTTISFYPLDNPPANFTDVSLGSTNKGVEAMDIKKFEQRSVFMNVPVLNTFLYNLKEMNLLRDAALGVCELILGQKPLAKALSQKYDVVMMENFNSDCMLGLLHVYGNTAPIIGLSSCSVMPWTPDRFGLPDNPAYIPFITSSFTDNMSFKQRFENSILYVYFKFWHRALQERERLMIEEYYGVRVPNLGDLAKQTQLLLINTFPNINKVRPLLPTTIEVGGMHLDHTKKDILPYIERFLNESDHGVILLSFGSLIKTATIPKYKEEIIVNTLAKFKQRVIWKYEDSGEEGTLTGNILRVKWLPQYELLQHKKVVAFIAHGGLLGMTEAVSAGKPMVVVPFFGDQPANGAAAEAVGFAKVVPYMELTEKALTEALEFVLSAQTRLNARRVSSIWRDRQADPLDTAVYWTERVIRWGHNAPLHSAARDMPLYQLALLDVIAAFVVAILILLALSWFILSMVFRLLFTKESKLKMH